MPRDNYMKLLIYILCHLVACSSYGAIITASSINSDEVKKIAALVDKNTLVIIELDNVLTMPRSKIFLPTSPYRRMIDSMISASNRSSSYNQILANWYTHRQLTLVEENWGNFIKALEAKGAVVVGISELNHVIYSMFNDPEIWKYTEITNLGINFTDKIGNQEMFQIEALKYKQAIFYKGIIFTGPYPKSYTIKSFLKVSNLMPKKLIIFDSNIERINEIERTVRSVNLDFYPIYYKAWSQIQGKVDDKIARLQENTLLYQGIWLEDEDAAQAMAK
jgi:Protein of unknown function (DUF2608)